LARRDGSRYVTVSSKEGGKKNVSITQEGQGFTIKKTTEGGGKKCYQNKGTGTRKKPSGLVFLNLKEGDTKGETLMVPLKNWWDLNEAVGGNTTNHFQR